MTVKRTVLCTAERIGVTEKFRFTCPNGHVTVESVNKGKPKHLRLQDHAIAMMASWWGKQKVHFACPVCAEIERAQAALKRYGRHDNGCKKWRNHIGDEPGLCSCGLDAELDSSSTDSAKDGGPT